MNDGWSLQLCCSSLDSQETIDPRGGSFLQPRKKKQRTKLIRSIAVTSSSNGGVVTKPKDRKKPDPGAPKITRPCTECGKKFWSWKALFGHMRCHPERQWRGINPPPNFRRLESNFTDDADADASSVDDRMSQEDEEVAACLLMLAYGTHPLPISRITESDTPPPPPPSLLAYHAQYHHHVVTQATTSECDSVAANNNNNNRCSSTSRFECSGCKKVFGSHQALGGHRASHKNVKGCFAITRNEEEEEEDHQFFGGHGIIDDDNDCRILSGGKLFLGGDDNHHHHHGSSSGHKCSICLRVFSSGQALGGHKRCHWDKDEQQQKQDEQGFGIGYGFGFGLDLNLPAPLQDESPSSYSSSVLHHHHHHHHHQHLDLRLGL